jgi:hypothetical protein
MSRFSKHLVDEEDLMSSKSYEGKMLIVTPDMDKGWIVFANKHVMDDIDQLGSHAIDDILGKEQPPEPGVWIWEGKVVWSSHQSFEGDYDCDVDYRNGTWRRPTDEETAMLVRGESPWPIPPEKEPWIDPNHKPEARNMCICCNCNGHQVPIGDLNNTCPFCGQTQAEINKLEGP